MLLVRKQGVQKRDLDELLQDGRETEQRRRHDPEFCRRRRRRSGLRVELVRIDCGVSDFDANNA